MMGCDLMDLAVPGVRGLHPYEPGKPMVAVRRELGIDRIVKLASNENPLGPAASVRQALAAVSPETVARYPDGNGDELKAALAAYHGVDPRRITLGNGSNEILELVTRAIVDPRHAVIYSEHAFAVYGLVTQAVGAEAVVVAVRDWEYDLEAMSAAITPETRLIFIANPNNPTGRWVSRRDLRVLLEACPEHVVVVVDEAYCDYVEEEDYPNCIEWLGEFPRLLVTRTFSKAFGLAGLRVGYGVSHPDLADLMNRVRQPFNINALALIAAKAALNDREHLRRSVAVNRAGMRRLVDECERLGLPHIPSAGNFFCVDCTETEIGSGEIYQRLLRQGVIVRPLANYGMPNHLRITVGLDDENTLMIEALRAALGA